MSELFVTSPQHTYAPVRICIYCNSTNNNNKKLTDEHIIPYGLGGRLILPESSCDNCAKITSQFEMHCLRRQFGYARPCLKIKSRKGSSPSSLDIETTVSDKTEIQTISLNDFPAILPMWHFNWLPEVLLNIPPTEVFEGRVTIRILRKDINHCLQKIKGKPNLIKPFEVIPFGKMLAKIAHAFAAAEVGLNNFKPCLTNLIYGIKPFYPTQFIGGNIIKAPIGKELHEISYEYQKDVTGRDFIVVRIHLFAPYDMPVHYVVVGEPN